MFVYKVSRWIKDSNIGNYMKVAIKALEGFVKSHVGMVELLRRELVGISQCVDDTGIEIW